ncbi:MAG: CotH kinase family protein [Flavobacteriales bacterium]
MNGNRIHIRLIILLAFLWLSALMSFLLLPDRDHMADVMYVRTSSLWRAPAGMFLKETKIQTRTLPLVRLEVEEEDLFSMRNGIYIQGYSGLLSWREGNVWDQPANYQERGRYSERGASVEIFSQSGKTAFSCNTRIRIHGNRTRSFPQKSIRIEKKKNNSFAGKELERFNGYSAFILRNGGNSWGRDLITDVLVHKLCTGLNVDHLEYVPVTVQINGEYWGIHFLTGRINESFLAKKHGVKKKQVEFLEWEKDVNAEKRLQFRKEWLALSKLPADSVAFRKLDEFLDIENFIDYVCTELYMGNKDWPANNVKMYKIRDGRWKWILHDMDFSLGYANEENASAFDGFAALKKSKTMMNILFTDLIKFKKFRIMFKSRMLFLMNHWWNNENVQSEIEALCSTLRPEIPLHCLRWRKPVSVSEWKEHVNYRREFLKTRRAFIEKQLVLHLSE